MPIELPPVEHLYDSERDNQLRAEFLYTKTAADLYALNSTVEQIIQDSFPPLTQSGVDTILTDSSQKIHCLLIATPGSDYTRLFQQGILNSPLTVGNQVWLLDKNGTDSFASQLNITQKKSGMYFFRQGKLIDVTEQPLTPGGRKTLIDGLEKNDSQKVNQGKNQKMPISYSNLDIGYTPEKKGPYDDLTVNRHEPTNNAPASTPQVSTKPTQSPTSSTTSTSPKNVSNREQGPVLNNGIDVSVMNRYIDGVHIKQIDPYVYAGEGSQIPTTWELQYDANNKLILLNGKDEGPGYLDKILMSINPRGLNSTTNYLGTESKYSQKLSYKLNVDSRGVLRIAFSPTPELIKKYKDDKRFDWKTVSLPKMPGGETLDDIIEQLKDIRPDFEGDPDSPTTSIPDPEETDAVESVGDSGLMFDGKKVNQIYSTVYGVPQEWLHDVKVDYDKSSKSFRIYKEGKLFSTLDNVTLNQLEHGNHDFSYTEGWFKNKITHNGKFNATIDDLGRLTVFWGDIVNPLTYPGYESVESPHGWVLPFVPNANTVVTDIFDTPRRCKKGKNCVNGWRPHQGIDIGMPKGTQINSIASGTVIDVKDHISGYGKQIVIDHGNGYKTRYAHLSAYAVKLGQKVVAGQKIAESGKTGDRTGKTGLHLHFEIIENGSTVNPAKYIDFTKYDSKRRLRGTKPRVKNTVNANNVFVGATEVGMATYYEETGNKTASGKVYDEMGNFCAHNVYPFGTVLKVTNLKTKKSEEVIVEDTGNFDKHGRIIDLSKGTMLRLGGTEGEGEYRVRTEVIKIGDRKNTKSGASGGSTNTGGNNAPKTTPTTPKKPNSPNAPSASPEIALMKEPPAYIATSLTFGGKQYAAYAPVIVDNPGASTKTAPRGWLVEVKKGNITVHTQEGIKTVASKGTFESGGKTYTLQAKGDNSNKAYPNAARFSIVSK